MFLGEHLTFIGILGLAGLLIGLLIVGLGFPLRRSERIMTNSRAIFIALGVALCISIYSAIDGKIVRRFVADIRRHRCDRRGWLVLLP